MKKILRKKVIKDCVICGEVITVFLYTDKSYRGGHYFGKMGICSKKEKDKENNSGTHKSKIHGHIFNVINYEAKPYKYVEYWECPRCYRWK
jgi:hypothetical protein